MKNIQIIDISDKANYDKKGWLCEENLIFFSDEWNLRNSQCINYINSCNGNYDRKIHGRKCVVLQINDSAVAKLFIDDYHIQGSNNLSVVYFGLYYEGELVAVRLLRIGLFLIDFVLRVVFMFRVELASFLLIVLCGRKR